MTFQPDMPLFVQLPLASSERVLNPGRCLEFSADDSVKGAFDDPSLPIEDGAELIVYFTRNQEFHKQPGKVVTASHEGEELILELELLGEPVSADSREHFRVSAYRENVVASLPDEPACDVVDVSASGLAIYSGVERTPGKIVAVTIDCEGDKATGRAAVQSVLCLGEGRYRYGFHCVEAPSSPLRKMLLRTSMTLQRRMLTRMSGRT